MSYDPVGPMTGGGDGLPGPSATHTLTLPGGAATGHLALVHSTVLSTTATATIASAGSGSWTVLSGPTDGATGTSTRSYVWWKVLTSGDIGNTVVVTWDASLRGLAVGIVYPAGTAGNIAYSSVTGGSSTITGNNVALNAGNSVVSICSVKANSGNTIPTIDIPSGYTLDKSSVSAGAPSANYRTTINHKAITVTGNDGAAGYNYSPASNGGTVFTVQMAPANLPPTVTVGSNQDVSAGATVSLTSTASDSDGTVASRLWTFDYPTSGAPTLTGSTSANASFTAGAVGNLYILRHTATDNLGATGYATMEVRVPTGGTIAPLAGAGTGAGTWTNTGGAGSEGVALNDASDSTYVESATASGTEQNRRWRLNPSSVRTSGTITVRVAQDISGTIVAKVRLFEGSTQRQEWTITTTTSIADQTVTLSGGTISAITDWGNLYVEVAVTG